MLHLDEARRNALGYLVGVLGQAPRGAKAVLIDDLFGRLRLVLWIKNEEAERLRSQIDQDLRRECERYWTGDIWLAQGGGRISPADRRVYDRAWDDARAVPESAGRLRLLDRHRNRGAWFAEPASLGWQVPRSGYKTSHPPVVVFYSFKGGVGRSTALASFAIRRARAGERLVVIDADLDAPGVGGLLTASGGEVARWGVVDYLLERPQGSVDLRDYYHACHRDAVTGPGEILVFPAVQVNLEYLGKLARADLEPPPAGSHPLHQLLQEARTELKPHWILVDARAGLADPAGMLLGGLAHLHVLFGTFSEQSWAGLRLVIERLGAERVRLGQPQADCLLVQAMVPENVETAQRTRRIFGERARDEYVDLYYAEDPESNDTQDDFWYVGDAGGSDAPHAPISLSYSSRLADYSSIDVVADHLADSSEYRHLASRIGARFGVT